MRNKNVFPGNAQFFMVGRWNTACFRMILEVKITAVRKTIEFFPSMRKIIFKINRALGIMRTVFRRDLHLREFACAEEKVAGCNFVTKCFPDLRDTEW